MDCDDVGFYYTFKDGFCSLSAIFDIYPTEEQPGLSGVRLGAIYPSKYIKNYFRRMHKNACRLFNAIGIKNGVLQLQAFYENGEFYVYDQGFRLQGGAPNYQIQAITGYNQLEMLIRFALTGSGGDFDLEKCDDPYFRGKSAATLWLILKTGVISRIEGLEGIADDPKVVRLVQRFTEGEEVLDEYIGSEWQVFAKLFLVCDSKEELAKTSKHYINTIKVYDTDGNNMLLKALDVDKVLGETVS